MIKKIAAVIVLVSAAFAFWHFSSSRQSVSVSYQNADGTYGEPVSVLSKSVRQGKSVTVRTPSSDIYPSRSVTYKAGLKRSVIIKVPRRKTSIRVSGKHLKWKLMVNGRESDGNSILAGSTYSIQNIEPDSGYLYSGVKGGSSAGRVIKPLNLNLESIKKHYRTVFSFSNGEAVLMSLVKGDRVALSDKIKIPADCTLASIKCGDKSYDIGDVFTQPARNVQIDVIFKEIWYTVTYNDAFNNPNPDKYRRSLTLEAPTRDGYEFIGWKDETGFVKSINHRNATLTAVWKKTITVSFDANGGEGAMTPLEGTEVTVPGCSFAQGGYSFAGWNTKKDGTGTQYAPGDKIKNTATLYAQWKIKNEIKNAIESTQKDSIQDSDEKTNADSMPDSSAGEKSDDTQSDIQPESSKADASEEAKSGKNSVLPEEE